MNGSINVHKVFACYFRGCETLAYALSSKLADGNICIDIKEYVDELPALLEEQKAKPSFIGGDVKFWSVDDFKKQCNEGEYVTHSGTGLKPFVILGGKAYLHRYFRYETQIIENITRLKDNFQIITGGPGTGKTYGVSTKLAEKFFENIHLKVALAAPTGKAAARMNESVKNFAEKAQNNMSEAVKTKLTGIKAQTIHRLLGSIKDSVFFKYNENNRMPYDIVIIDECSMIDGALMAKLMNAVADNTQLYLLGDKDQLASVESGSVFGDMCRACESPLLKGKIEFKTESHRFDAAKGIGRFSREVIEGTFSTISVYDEDEQLTIDTSHDELLFKKYALEYKAYLLEPDIKTALQLLNKVRFLCVTRENEQSVDETNMRIERILKYAINDLSIFNPAAQFYHNQPIIITQNNYDLGVFNGDVGLIRREDDRLVAYFESTDGEIKKIPAGYLSSFDTVFAMTIHKSQGSEFEHVVVILPEKQGGKLLTRELLYTGVTRAKTKAILQTSEDTLIKCVQRSVSRSSGLEQRLTEKE